MPPRAVKISASVTITRCLSHQISACVHMLWVRSRRGRLKSCVGYDHPMPQPRDISAHAQPVRKKPPGAVKVSASMRGYADSRQLHPTPGSSSDCSELDLNPLRELNTTGIRFLVISVVGASVRGCRYPERRRCWQVKAGCRKRSQHRVNAGLEGRSERPTGRGIGNPGAWRTIPREAALLASERRPGGPE